MWDRHRVARAREYAQYKRFYTSAGLPGEASTIRRLDSSHWADITGGAHLLGAFKRATVGSFEVEANLLSIRTHRRSWGCSTSVR